MNTTNNCSEAKKELIPGMDMLIDHMKKQSLEIERLRQENKELKEYNEFIRKTCSMADERIKQLEEQVNPETGEVNPNFVYTSSEEEEKVNLEWMCYEFVRYDYNPEDGSVYDTDGTKIAHWDDQGEGKMIWVDKKYEDKHKKLAKKSMNNLVAMATS